MPTPSTPPRPTRPSGDTTTYPPAPPAVSGAAPGHLGGCVVFLLRNLLRNLLRSLLFAMTSIAVVHIGGAVREAGLQLLQGEGHSVAAPAALAVVEAESSPTISATTDSGMNQRQCSAVSFLATGSWKESAGCVGRPAELVSALDGCC
jgi:hypothetical protein